MQISNSKAKTFLGCFKAYEYKYVRGLRARQKGYPLAYGSWMHSLLETYAEGGDWRKTHVKLKKEFDGYFDEEKEMLGDLPTECYRKMEAYVYWWERQGEGIDDFDVLATELDLEVPMPHGHTMKLFIDRITQDELGIWIWEHKTRDRVEDSIARLIDIQSARYAWAVKHGTDFGEVTGIIWDYLIRKSPTEPHINKNGQISKRKINTDLHTYLRFLKRNGLDPRDHRDVIMRLRKYNSFFERKRVPVTDRISKILVREMIYTADMIERGQWKPVRNIGKHCKWCDFQKICVTELYGGDAASVLEGSYDVKGGEDGDEDEEENQGEAA